MHSLFCQRALSDLSALVLGTHSFHSLPCLLLPTCCVLVISPHSESYWGSYFNFWKRRLCALWSLGAGRCRVALQATCPWPYLVPLQGRRKRHKSIYIHLLLFGVYAGVIKSCWDSFCFKYRNGCICVGATAGCRCQMCMARVRFGAWVLVGCQMCMTLPNVHAVRLGAWM